ncbi:ribbon-helix-helix domain-containing protein [Paracoccus salsus]|uniref:ribbon-helix-helix domain-containing protein n=1 Tax=Paracoccus salsus TaxID=2911061 RepID=UPI001F3A708B|nr:ribbon-helix-helix domain-containing protein [Paracoccus salsus]
MKRSVTIDGHRTSVSLEDPFWSALGQAARARHVTRAVLIGKIDHARPPEVGLATAIRLFVLADLQKAARSGQIG